MGSIPSGQFKFQIEQFNSIHSDLVVGDNRTMLEVSRLRILQESSFCHQSSFIVVSNVVDSLNPSITLYRANRFLILTCLELVLGIGFFLVANLLPGETVCHF